MMKKPKYRLGDQVVVVSTQQIGRVAFVLITEYHVKVLEDDNPERKWSANSFCCTDHELVFAGEITGSPRFDETEALEEEFEFLVVEVMLGEYRTTIIDAMAKDGQPPDQCIALEYASGNARTILKSKYGMDGKTVTSIVNRINLRRQGGKVSNV